MDCQATGYPESDQECNTCLVKSYTNSFFILASVMTGVFIRDNEQCLGVPVTCAKVTSRPHAHTYEYYSD